MTLAPEVALEMICVANTKIKNSDLITAESHFAMASIYQTHFMCGLPKERPIDSTELLTLLSRLPKLVKRKQVDMLVLQPVEQFRPQGITPYH